MCGRGLYSEIRCNPTHYVNYSLSTEKIFNGPTTRFSITELKSVGWVCLREPPICVRDLAFLGSRRDARQLHWRHHPRLRQQPTIRYGGKSITTAPSLYHPRSNGIYILKRVLRTFS